MTAAGPPTRRSIEHWFSRALEKSRQKAATDLEEMRREAADAVEKSRQTAAADLEGMRREAALALEQFKSELTLAAELRRQFASRRLEALLALVEIGERMHRTVANADATEYSAEWQAYIERWRTSEMLFSEKTAEELRIFLRMADGARHLRENAKPLQALEKLDEARSHLFAVFRREVGF